MHAELVRMQAQYEERARDAEAERARVNHELEVRQQELTAAQAALQEEQRTTAGQAARLSGLDARLVSGQEELTAAQAALQEEQRTTAGQAARLSGLEGKLVVMHRQTQERVVELAMLTRRMLRAEARVGRVTAQRKRQIAEQGQQLIAMQGSTSWRVTAPLRSLSGRVRASHVLPAKLTRKD
jgi:Skp family chaperone for outer membrane proteins